MKKVTTMLFLLVTLTAMAQPQGEPGKRKEKVEQLRIAYITEKLPLTSAEAEKFWPVYNEFTDKLRETKKGNMQLRKDLHENLEKLSEGEIKEKIEMITVGQQKELDLQTEYGPKIASVVGYKKAVKLVSLEKEFRQELRKELQKRKEERLGPPPGQEE